MPQIDVSQRELPPAVIDALVRGRKIDAIALLREATGCGLKTALDAVQAYLERSADESAISRPVAATDMATDAGQAILPPAVMDALRRGEKIQAVKLLREATGLGLKDANDRIHGFIDGADLPPSDAAAVVSTAAPSTSRPPTVVSGRSGSGIGWILLIAALAIAGWFFLRG